MLPWTWKLLADVKVAMLTVVMFAVVTYAVPKGDAAFPIPTVEELARRFPVKVEKAPWTVRFC